MLRAHSSSFTTPLTAAVSVFRNDEFIYKYVMLADVITRVSIWSLGLLAELDGAFHRLCELRATRKLEDLLANLLNVLAHCRDVVVG
ncbi:hypothetical protein ATCVTN60342_150L [Acanthocystis turfacea Chlorella virus TN603.4.2]|nr:hypothetical protein ATCVTN60342_150L [Acanthocystis turfacea Chlorella virus TN603.4.2]